MTLATQFSRNQDCLQGHASNKLRNTGLDQPHFCWWKISLFFPPTSDHQLSGCHKTINIYRAARQALIKSQLELVHYSKDNRQPIRQQNWYNIHNKDDKLNIITSQKGGGVKEKGTVSPLIAHHIKNIHKVTGVVGSPNPAVSLWLF